MINKFALPLSDTQLLEECEVIVQACASKEYEKQNCVVYLRHVPTGIVTASKQESNEYLNQIVCLKKLRLEAGRQGIKTYK